MGEVVAGTLPVVVSIYTGAGPGNDTGTGTEDVPDEGALRNRKATPLPGVGRNSGDGSMWGMELQRIGHHGVSIVIRHHLAYGNMVYCLTIPQYLRIKENDC